MFDQTNWKIFLKSILAFIIAYSGIPSIIRNIYARNKVSILVYHDPKPEDLDRHLNYLSKRYNFITLDCLVNAIHSKNWKDVPPKSLIITIDDGNKGNFDFLEVFIKYKVKPTIYLCSGIVNTNRKFWFKACKGKPNYLKKYSNEKRLNILETKNGFTVTKDFSEEERQALSHHEIITMKDYVDFESHSLFHPILTTCTYEECEREIVGSKENVEMLTNKICRHFSYPNGNYSEREIEIVQKAGYLSARTADNGWNDSNTDPYRLKIVAGIADDASINWLVAQLTGITDHIKLKLKTFGVDI